MASNYDHAAVVKLLLAVGANTNAKDKVLENLINGARMVGINRLGRSILCTQLSMFDLPSKLDNCTPQGIWSNAYSMFLFPLTFVLIYVIWYFPRWYVYWCV